MKTLLLNHNIEGRGTFHRCVDFARLLTAKGHEPTIVTNSKTDRLHFGFKNENGIQIIRTPDLFWGILRTGWDPVNILRRFFYLSDMKFDVIHAFDNRPTVILPALWLSRKWKCPLVSDWCDWWGRGGAITQRKHKLLNLLFSPVETFFEEHYRQFADHITVISEALKIRAIKLGISESRISIFPPMVDIQRFYPIDKAEARKRLNLTQYSHVLIFSGFVLYDLDVILKAFQKVHEVYPKCVLLLTGGVPEAETQKIKGLPFINLDFIADDLLNDYLGASDLCLMPLVDNLTNRARYPHKIGRYLAAGRPVVTNRVGDAGQLIADTKSGFLAPSDSETFAATICGALSDLKRLETYGHRARQAAEQKLSGGHFSDKIEQIYLSCQA